MGKGRSAKRVGRDGAGVDEHARSLSTNRLGIAEDLAKSSSLSGRYVA